MKTERHGAARDRLGLPRMAGHRPLAASLVIDSLGDGLFVPFAIVYFLHTTRLPLTTIGVALSAAGLVAVGTVIPAGILLDRLRPARLVVAANLLSAVGFAGYLTVGRVWPLVLFALLAAVGSRLYWTANLALVGDAFPAAERSRWFAFQRALRNTGFGLGGLLGAVAISAGGTAGYHALAAVNAASYLTAAALVFTWARTHHGPAAAQPKQDQEHEQAPQPAARTAARSRGGGFRVALTDRPFLLVVATNLLFVLCSLVLDVLLAVYVTRGLGFPVWVSGLLFALNTAIVALAQTSTSRAVERLPPAWMLQLTALVWACAFAVFWLTGLVPAVAAVPLLFAALLIFTLAEMIQGPALNDLVVTIAPEPVRGRYLGVYQLSWGIGSAAAPALFSWLYTSGNELPWIVLGVACLGWTLVLGAARATGPPATARSPRSAAASRTP